MPGVAVHADCILLVDRGTVFAAKRDNRGMTCADVSAPRMVTTRAMTTFALQMGKGCIRVAALSVRSAKNNQHALIVMARQAGVRTFVAVSDRCNCRWFWFRTGFCSKRPVTHQRRQGDDAKYIKIPDVLCDLWLRHA